jgi:hypothetical protein
MLDLYDGRGLFADLRSLWTKVIASLGRFGWLAVNWAEFTKNPGIRARAEMLATYAETNVYLTELAQPDNLIQLLSPSRMTLDHAAERLRTRCENRCVARDPLSDCYFSSAYPPSLARLRERACAF